MGCDIHCFSEKAIDGKYVMIEGLNPFIKRDYGIWGFLTNIRNNCSVPPIQLLLKGIPKDCSIGVLSEYGNYINDSHHVSYIETETLYNFNYDNLFRNTADFVPLEMAKAGIGKLTSFRDFLGKSFFDDLESLKENNVDRIVFWFDN